MLSDLSVPTPLFLAQYTNLAINDHSGATAVGYVDAWKFIVFVLMCFHVAAEHSAARYDCRDLRMSHEGCCVITPRLNGVRLFLDHFLFSQFLAGRTFNQHAAYPA